MKFIQAIRNASSRLKADLADSELFGQMVERGRFREWAIERLLRPHIPEAFGISSGLVFSSNDSSSRQLDVVLYDQVFGNALFRDWASSLFPAECVYGAIEVKSRLDSAELSACIENCASLKRLERESATAASITPICELRVGEGLQGPTAKLNQYFHCVFAFDSIDPETIAKDLTSRLSQESNLPDYLWILKKAAFIFRFRKTPAGPYQPAPLDAVPDMYIAVDMGDDLLPIMLLTLNTLLARIRLKAPDYNKYWTSLFGDAVGRARLSTAGKR